jgi:hypothetical protein
MSNSHNSTIERRVTYSTLSSIFLALLLAFSQYKRRQGEHVNITPFDLTLLGISTYRLGRLFAYDKVMETARTPFTETAKDSSGMGKTVIPKKDKGGIIRAFGELISCPICMGTWIAAGLTYGLHMAPRPTRALLTMTSAVGVAELLNAATEAMKWTGRAEREESSVLHSQH